MLSQVNAEASKIEKEAEECNAIATDCQRDLDKALPALQVNSPPNPESTRKSPHPASREPRVFRFDGLASVCWLEEDWKQGILKIDRDVRKLSLSTGSGGDFRSYIRTVSTPRP